VIDLNLVPSNKKSKQSNNSAYQPNSTSLSTSQLDKTDEDLNSSNKKQKSTNKGSLIDLSENAKVSNHERSNNITNYI